MCCMVSLERQPSNDSNVTSQSLHPCMILNLAHKITWKMNALIAHDFAKKPTKKPCTRQVLAQQNCYTIYTESLSFTAGHGPRNSQSFGGPAGPATWPTADLRLWHQQQRQRHVTLLEFHQQCGGGRLQAAERPTRQQTQAHSVGGAVNDLRVLVVSHGCCHGC